MLGSLFSRRKSETPQGVDHDIRKTSMLRGRFRMRRSPSCSVSMPVTAVDITKEAAFTDLEKPKQQRSSHKREVHVKPPPGCRFLLTPQKMGSGAYGVVLSGVETSTNTKVAVKLIPDGRMKVTSLEREINILKRLSDAGHPAHLKFYAHCRPSEVKAGEVHAGSATIPLPKMTNKLVPLGSCHALVMEPARGGEVFDHVIRVDGLVESQSGPLFAQLCDSVRAAHILGIVHRDLKLENVLLVGKEGESGSQAIKLIDWGLAHQHALTADGKVVPEMLKSRCGSRSYMAPEVTNRDVCGTVGYDGFSSDVWSLGVCLFAMHLGFFPFEHANPAVDWRARRVVEAQTSGGSTLRTILSFYPSNKQSSRMSDALVALLDRMLVFDPKNRASLPEVLASEWLSPHVSAFASTLCGATAVLPELDLRNRALTTSSESTAMSTDTDTDSVAWRERSDLLHRSTSTPTFGATAAPPLTPLLERHVLERENGECDSDARSTASSRRSVTSTASRRSVASSTATATSIAASTISTATSHYSSIHLVDVSAHGDAPSSAAALAATLNEPRVSSASTRVTSIDASYIHRQASTSSLPSVATNYCAPDAANDAILTRLEQQLYVDRRPAASSPPQHMPPGHESRKGKSSSVPHGSMPHVLLPPLDTTSRKPRRARFGPESDISAATQQRSRERRATSPIPARASSVQEMEAAVVRAGSIRPTAKEQQQQEQQLADLMHKACKVSRAGSPRRPDRPKSCFSTKSTSTA